MMETRWLLLLFVLLSAVPTPGLAQTGTAEEHFNRGVALHAEGRYEEAVRAFEEALQLDPSSSETYRKRGLSYRELGRFDLTYADYERALAADARNTQVHRSFAIALGMEGRYDEALRWCDQGLEIDSAYVDLWITRGSLLLDLNRVEDAARDFGRALELEPRNKYALNLRGLCRRRLGDATSALEDFDRALAVDPGFTAAHVNRAFALVTLERYADAARSAERAIALDPTATAYRVLGNARRLQRKPKQAAAAYDRCLELDPDNRLALLDRSAVRLNLGDLDGAFSDANHLLSLDPENKRAFNNRGAALERMDRLAEALRDFETALRLDPVYELAQSNRARVAGKLGVSVAAVPSAPAPSVPVAPSPDLPAGPATQAASGHPSTIPLLEFSPTDDPCELAARPTDGLPWQVAGPLSDEAPTQAGAGSLPPFLELETMSRAQWTGAVSAAVEGLRLAYGAMPAEDVRRFESAWVPMYDLPSAAAVEYLNRLNPLLGQFHAGREALMRTIAAGQAAIFDAAYAVSGDSPEAWESAMAMADRQADSIQSLEAGLRQVAAQIQALGNPPNPFAERCEARKRYRRGLRDRGASPIDGVWTDETGNWESYRTVLTPRPDLWLVYRVAQDYYERVALLASAGHDVSKADVFEIDDGEGGKRMEWTVGILDHMLVVASREQGRKVLLYPYGPAISIVTEAWELVADGVADRTVVDEPPAAFGGDPKWSENRMYRDQVAAPRFSHQHTVESVRAVVARYLDYGLSAFDAFTAGRGDFIARLLEADRPDVPTPTDPATTAPPPAEGKADPVTAANAEREAEIQETIAFHEDMARVLERNLSREQEEFNRTLDPRRRKELSLRILTLQADIQAERDLAASYRGGVVVHTRTLYDDWAQGHFVARIREETARVDATRRIAAGVERQIELLPWEQRQAMRQRARELLDSKTIAQGDVEKARRVANALNEMVQGTWEGEAARAEERAIAAQEHEFYTQTFVMTAGTVAVGFGWAAAVQAFGETAALSLWAPHLLGGVYGGVTGTIAGGPVEGITQALSTASPAGALVVQFAEGYKSGLQQSNATWYSAGWEGAKQAGAGWFIAKGIQAGARLTMQGALAFAGPQNRLFRPIGGGRNSGLTVRDAFDEARYNQARGDAESLINHFREAQTNLMRARTQFPAGSPQLAAAESEARRLAVSLNSSYHCKWLLKYKAHPSLRRAFSSHVDAAYDDTLPLFRQKLRELGYDTSNLRFRPLRNASSSGTSSMDLDLALEEPNGLVIWKTDPVTGTRRQVALNEFQSEAQQALNGAYHDTTGFSALRSEVNLTTSVHDEAFRSKALLQHDVDFSKVDPRDFADIGRVVDFKTSKIEGDPVLSRIAKLQAQCRETSKEIDNMLLKELRQARAGSKTSSPESQQLDADIRYWEEMLARLRRIGSDETDPHQILMLNRELRRDTGGLGAEQIVRDVGKFFRMRAGS